MDREYISKNLIRIFNKKLAKRVIRNIQKNNFTFRPHRFVFYYIFKSKKNVKTFINIFFRWLKWKRFGNNYPLISFIGPDGSGKSWNAEELRKVLEMNNRNVELIYTGRGKGNLLPIKKIANIYKKKETKKVKAKKIKIANKDKAKLAYTLAAPFYTLDLLLRYLFIIFPKRKKKIIITDRYCSDILLMTNVPLKLKKFLLSLFPKPTITFYLHNDPQILFDRRKQQPPEELEWQMDMFEHLEQ